MICTSSYKFHGVQFFLTRRCIIHENFRTLTRENSPSSVLSSPVMLAVVRCAFNGRLRRCIDWEQGRIGGRDTKRSDVIVGTKTEGVQDKGKRRPWPCARMQDHVPFEPFRDSRELSRASVSLQKWYIASKLYTVTLNIASICVS